MLPIRPQKWQSVLPSPPIVGDKEKGVDVDDSTTDFPSTEAENEKQKQKIAQRMLSWHQTYGRGEDVNALNYDKEVSRNHVSGDFLERLSMASPLPGGRIIPSIPYRGEIGQSRMFCVTTISQFDDGAAMFSFEFSSEKSEFAKKYNIGPRAPEWWMFRRRPGEGGSRFWNSIGLGFKTLREAIEVFRLAYLCGLMKLSLCALKRHQAQLDKYCGTYSGFEGFQYGSDNSFSLQYPESVIPIVVTDTGWPWAGGANKRDAMVVNAEKFNNNLIQRLMNDSGPPSQLTIHAHQVASFAHLHACDGVDHLFEIKTV
ncbi:hypothetical protein Tco_0356258 [Tanacetum coccineum]